MIDAAAAIGETFHFLRPAWLFALAGVPVLALLWRWRARRESPWAGVVDASLQPHVLDGGVGRLPRLPWRLVLVFTLGVLALAGPAWRSLPVDVFQSSDALVAVVDLSSASRAADLQPDRITRARLKLARLIERRDGGLLGLAVFSGSAHTVSPLTADSETLRRLVDALDPGLMPVDGHRPDVAIRHAQALLENAGHERGRILLLTDRSDARAAEAAAQARASGFVVHVLGVGHVDGAPVRDSAGGFERGPGGDVRVARLDPASLRGLAQAGGGRFRAIEPGDADLESLGVLASDGAQARGEALAVVRYRDDGIWLLPPMLLLLLPGFRRGALAMLALGLGLGVQPSPLQAAQPEALWQRPDQRAYRALVEEDYERARALARDPMIRGAAAFRLGDHAGAAEAFGEAGGSDGMFNRGNALAAAGRYEDALAAWRESLAIDPSNEDAQANLASLQDWLERRPEPPPSAPPEEGAGSPPDGGGEDSSGSDDADPSGEPDPGADESAASGGEPGEDAGGADLGDVGEDEHIPESGTDADADRALSEAIEQALAQRGEPEGDEAEAAMFDAEMREAQEREEAIERMLRLVEDDPGALLRRKFMIEHQRRLRGEGRP